MSKVTLSDPASFQNDSTAVALTVANNNLIEQGFNNTVSLDGTQPNSMQANLDMNSNRVLNLPAPVSADEPARLQDIANLAAGTPVTLNNLPTGGTTGQLLKKNSNTNFDFSWANLPANQAVISFNTNQGVVTYSLNSSDFTIVNGNSSSSVNMTAARKTLPTRQIFTSGSGTYTTPANCLYVKVTMAGGGGGGGGSGTSGAGAGGTGGNTTFSTFTANGGAGGTGGSISSNPGGVGGTASGGSLNFAGGRGDSTTNFTTSAGNPGARGGQNSFFCGAGNSMVGVGNPGITNTGGGGSGGAIGGSTASASGGGAGGACAGWISAPVATYAYTVGAAGAAGTAGVSGNAGGAGAAGILIVEEFYNS